MAWRPRSLFWTFAGAFLAVVAVAALVQGWVLGALATALAEEQATSSAQRPALQASLDISWNDPMPPWEQERILHQYEPPNGAYFLVYRSDDGEISLPWPTVRSVRHRIARWIETGVDSWEEDAAYDARFPHIPPGRETDPPPAGDSVDRNQEPPRRPAARPAPHPRDGRPPALDPARRHPPDRRPPGRGGPPRPPRPDGPGALGGPERPKPQARDPRPKRRESDFPALGNLKVIARVPAMQGDERLGEVLVVHPVRRVGLFSRSQDGTPTLLLVPTALVLAALAGLVLFRLLTRRLRRLESMAGRIASGDLAARVPSPGDEELGRLGTKLNHMAESLQAARTELEASSEQRRRLLADISHELATPLTSIRGYAETLLADDVPTTADEQSEYLEHVVDEARRMERLLGDLFELTRLEAGIGEFDPEPLDLGELCRHTLERFRKRFDEVGLTLRFEGHLVVSDDSSDGALRVIADGRRMEQVIENLLTNALRYVPGGESGGSQVTASVRREEGALVLEVADDGPGFPEEDLPHVFDRFYRSAATVKVAGTGLGLAIVQEIVLRHGGRVEAENGVNGGAVLRVVLPSPESSSS